MLLSLALCSVLSFAVLGSHGATRPLATVYGVNLGSWLLIEPWMLPEEWISMGGQICDDCSSCIASEYAFSEAYPNTVDETFAQHWDSWFTEYDVDKLANAGINTVRIPLGYWLVEALVDRRSEYYPRGGFRHLRRGLLSLKKRGIKVILDHHALPGVSSPNQMFAGRCTSKVEFYTPYNYHRALIWTAVMTAISHLDPAFSDVFSIQAINEPIMDARQTPGYGEFQKNFVLTVRAVEVALGILPRSFIGLSDNDTPPSKYYGDSSVNAKAKLKHIPTPDLEADFDFSSTLLALADSTSNANANTNSPLSSEIKQVLRDTVKAFKDLHGKFGFDIVWPRGREVLVTNFMDINWQHHNPSNPADAARGPQIYDNHLYYSFGGVANATEEAYLTHLCNLDRIQKDAALGNSPLWFGEWSLATQFTATDAFLNKWADAQKLKYSEDAGWIFWNFKTEVSDLGGGTPRAWSYYEGLKRGYFTKDPRAYHDPDVCKPYI